MPYRFVPDGELDHWEILELFIIGVVESTAVCLAILAAVYLTMGLGDWSGFAYQ